MVVDRVVTKGHIAHNQIKIAVGEWCGFKTLGKDRAIGVEFLGNPGGEAVQFNACPVPALQTFGHEPEKMADAHSRLKDFKTAAHAELLQSVPDRVNNQGGREMRVGGCRAG